jgi:hypothetical protein
MIEKIRLFFMILVASVLFVFKPMTAWAGGEEKQVCVDVKDSKGNVVKKADGQPKQSCKTVKVHKKVEGEKVPDAKKK